MFGDYTYAGYGDRPYSDRDAANKSRLEGLGQVTYQGHVGTGKQVYDKLKEFGATEAQLDEYTQSVGR